MLRNVSSHVTCHCKNVRTSLNGTYVTYQVTCVRNAPLVSYVECCVSAVAIIIKCSIHLCNSTLLQLNSNLQRKNDYTAKSSPGTPIFLLSSTIFDLYAPRFHIQIQNVNVV
jgi:hypothetical protein